MQVAQISFTISFTLSNKGSNIIQVHYYFIFHACNIAMRESHNHLYYKSFNFTRKSMLITLNLKTFYDSTNMHIYDKIDMLKKYSFVF
jgi:hypothetical protein